MTVKQLTRLANRIESLRRDGRIVWIEGISADIIKGKVQGRPVYFVRAESLNADGGHWFYIVSWSDVRIRWECSCESVKPCKHQVAVNALLVEKYQRERITGSDLVQHVEDDLRYEAYKAERVSSTGVCACGRKSKAAVCDRCVYGY